MDEAKLEQKIGLSKWTVVDNELQATGDDRRSGLLYTSITDSKLWLLIIQHQTYKIHVAFHKDLLLDPDIKSISSYDSFKSRLNI